MASEEDIVSTLLNENTKQDFLTASSVLIKFANNVLNNPDESKYRKIRIANPAVQSKLLNFVGGMECLFLMGFEETEDGEHLTLPREASLQSLKEIRDGLVRESSKLQTSQPGSQTPQSSQPPRPASQAVQQTSQAPMQALSRFQTESETAFVARVRAGMSRVLQYEKPHVQQKARSTIPLDRLQAEAEANLKSAQENGDSKLDTKDFLLLALLKWFKFSFFKWVDTLPCSQCCGVTRHNGSVEPSNDDLRWGASRVEAHFCNICRVTTRFPRYTNPEKLLETQRGRCGEWADCFTLCCRALGYEARYVMDWTDHVWTEVYSTSRSRWLHCDPCENICDKPLLYESGWGKKLTYVIAVSKEEVQDVTWRYSAKHAELLGRRNLCREPWLRRFVHQTWRQQLSALPDERQKQLWTRLLCELTEFICVKAEDENLPGRSTGSLAWRQARGELGSATGAGTNQSAMDVNTSANRGFVFTPTESERQAEVIHVVYNSSTDKYVRKSSANQEHGGWQSCVFSCKRIFRKEEFDWKVSYLARNDSAAESEITWKFDLSGTDLRVGKVELKAQSAVFENGRVSWRICAGDNCFQETGASLQQGKTINMNGSTELTLTAVLDRGKGDIAWQHTQLFRQPMDDKDSNPFEIKLMLN